MEFCHIRVNPEFIFIYLFFCFKFSKILGQLPWFTALSLHSSQEQTVQTSNADRLNDNKLQKRPELFLYIQFSEQSFQPFWQSRHYNASE